MKRNVRFSEASTGFCIVKREEKTTVPYHSQWYLVLSEAHLRERKRAKFQFLFETSGFANSQRKHKLISLGLFLKVSIVE